MNHASSHFLSEDKRVLLARACTTFPGQKLKGVITRVLADIPKDLAFVEFFENMNRYKNRLLKAQAKETIVELKPAARINIH